MLGKHDAAMAAALTMIDRQFGANSIHDQHKHMARKVLRALAMDEALPAEFTDLEWGLPQDVDAALHQVEVFLSMEKQLHRRYAAGAWYLHPSRRRLAVLTAANIALRWMRRAGE